MDAELDKRITIAAVLIGYPKDAILFVLNGWSGFDVVGQAHIDGASLCWQLHDYALKLYGKKAREKLREWKINTTMDFGNIVFGLAEHGLIQTDETDSISDFENVFDFEDEFLNPKFAIANRRNHQLKLSTIFAITTLCAILVSGFTRGGLDGIWPALFTSWFVFLGLSCMVIGMASPAPEKVILLCFGIVSFAMGMFGFFTLGYW